MSEIQTTFHNGNVEDRDFENDLWLWLKEQPKDVWLLLVRVLNWDQVDRLFHRMVEHPRCDLAVAYHLFWSSSPDHYVETPKAYTNGTLIAKIVNNCARGFYTSAELFCDPAEFVLPVHRYLKAMDAAGSENIPFTFPHVLIGPLKGRKAAVPNEWTQDLWVEINDVVANYDAELPRSEDEYWRIQVAGGNVRVGEILKKWGKLQATAGTGTVSEQLQRVYGSKDDVAKALKAIPQEKPVYMQQQSILNPDIKQRYFGFALLALSGFGGVALLLKYLLS